MTKQGFGQKVFWKFVIFALKSIDVYEEFGLDNIAQRRQISLQE